MNQQEIELVAQKIFLGTEGEVKAPWRGTWAEHVVRGTMPEPIFKSTTSDLRGHYYIIIGLKEHQDFIIERVWGELTVGARENYRKALDESMLSHYDRLNGYDVRPPFNDPRVSEELAVIDAASNVEWDFFYSKDHQFFVSTRPRGDLVKITGWMMAL